MTIEVGDIAQWAFGLLSLSLSALVKVLWSQFTKLQEVVYAMKEELPNRYVQKDDFKQMRTEVLDAISKLDNLVREAMSQPKK